MDEVYRKELLQSALDARIREVTEYQVNIDNFRLAIDMVGDDQQLQCFRNQLEELLASSIVEQKKAKLMMEVIQSQLR